MNAGTWLRLGERCALGGLCGLAAFALLAHLLLLLHTGVPAALLPLLLLAGTAAVRPAAAPVGAGAPRWLWLGALGLLFAAAAAVAVGSLATPSRCWDGAVAWDLKAAALAARPTLEQPFFRDWGVFCHSRDYPLTLPLLLASGARLGASRAALPLLYVLLLLLVGTTLRRAGRGGAMAWLVALAVGLTPMLLNPSSGAADSGYAEPLLLLAVTGMAVGLLLRAPLPLMAGAALAVLAKPEGLLYGALPVVVAFVACQRRLLLFAALGWLLASAVWLPLQHDLARFGQAGLAWPLPLAALGAALLVLGLDRWLPARPRPRLLAAALTLPTLALLPAALAVALGDAFGTLGVYLGEPTRALQRLVLLPEILLGLLRFALLKHFGLAFWLLLVLAVDAARRRRRFADGRLAGFVALGLGAILVPFLLSPETDLEHHLASSMDRLLLHWLGAVLLLVGAELADRLQAGDATVTTPLRAPAPDTRR